MTAEAFSLKQSIMTEETLTPIFKSDAPAPAKPIGRSVDCIAALIAGLGAGLSGLGAVWFFLGFAENDTRLEHLTSAVVLTLTLFSFAIIPFTLVARFAWHAYRHEAKRAHLLWTVFLMLPWVGLGILTISHTPLPVWCGFIVTALAILLSLWALVSLVLEWKIGQSNTQTSQQNELPNTKK